MTMQPPSFAPMMDEDERLKIVERVKQKLGGAQPTPEFISTLTEEEKAALFQNYDGKRAVYGSMMTDQPSSEQTVGRYGIYTRNGWQDAANAVSKLAGAYGMSKLDKQERLGREAAGRIQGQISAADSAKRLKDEEDERAFLLKLFGGAV